MKDPAHPGDFVQQEVLNPLGLSTTRAAQVLGVGRPALSSLLNGRSSLSPEMAIRLEKAFGVDMGLLMRMQLNYNIAEAKRKAARIQVERFDPKAA